MSTNHPYPKNVIESVAKALMKSSETRDAFGAGGDWEAAGHTIKQEFVDHAETALQTLWDASRVIYQPSLISDLRALHKPAPRVPSIIADPEVCKHDGMKWPCATERIIREHEETNDH